MNKYCSDFRVCSCIQHEVCIFACDTNSNTLKNILNVLHCFGTSLSLYSENSHCVHDICLYFAEDHMHKLWAKNPKQANLLLWEMTYSYAFAFWTVKNRMRLPSALRTQCSASQWLTRNSSESWHHEKQLYAMEVSTGFFWSAGWPVLCQRSACWMLCLDAKMNWIAACFDDFVCIHQTVSQ